MGLVELAERGELDHRLDVVLEQGRQDVDIGRRGVAEARADADEIAGHVLEQDRPLVGGGLADQALAQVELAPQLVVALGAVARDQLEPGFLLLALGDVEDAILGVHQRRQLGHDQVRDGGQVALALEHAREAGEVGLQPVLLGVLERLLLQVADHLVDVVLERRHFARRLDRDRAGQIALGHRGRHFGDRAHLVGQVGGELVDVVGEVAPQAGGAGHARLAAEPALDADLAGHVGHLVAEGRQRLDHEVDRLGERRDLALGVDGQLALQIALRHRGDDVGDAAHLVGEVGRHQIDVVGQVLPGAADAGHLRLAAEFAFGADLARHARHFRGEAVELIDHDVDRVLELEDLALHVDGDLLGKVALRHRGGHVGDVADLAGEIVGHQIDVVGQVLPGAGDAAHLRLAAQLAFGADLARHARHLRGERR